MAHTAAHLNVEITDSGGDSVVLVRLVPCWDLGPAGRCPAASPKFSSAQDCIYALGKAHNRLFSYEALDDRP